MTRASRCPIYPTEARTIGLRCVRSDDKAVSRREPPIEQQRLLTVRHSCELQTVVSRAVVALENEISGGFGGILLYMRVYSLQTSNSVMRSLPRGTARDVGNGVRNAALADGDSWA